ncbi:MAG: aldo/keto reductase [SAR324 cluster bacterium]|nr:aldo/keto reductase [SAR324 cluster bacterium]
MGEGATAEDTRRFADETTARQQLSSSAFRPLGRTGLVTSAIGFGAYRIDAQIENHRAALRQALRRGVNLIDTSSNYNDGRSETLIGEVLAEDSEAAPELRRRTILVSKVGYVQASNMELAKQAISAGQPYPEMVEYNPTCWHCIHPRFLGDQLRLSLERLRVDTLDVYLLHNPEYFFLDWKKRNPGGELAAARGAFYDRIGAAFRLLEQRMLEGVIRWYGVSSNTFGQHPEKSDFISLEKLIAVAGEAAREVHGVDRPSGFAVVQCPLNLYEGGPYLLANQRDGAMTFLELARESDLAVLVNRPLNAIRPGGLVRLADFPVPRPNVEQEIQHALDGLRSEEQACAALFRPQVAHALPKDAGPHTPFEWSGPLRRALDRMNSKEQWNRSLEDQIYPHLHNASRFMQQQLSTPGLRKDFTAWYPGYCRKLEDVAGMISEWLGRADFARSNDMHERLEPLLEARLRGLPLSQKALVTLLALPGVSCVLNGMRRTSYVEDSTGAMAAGPCEAAAADSIMRSFAEPVA